MSPSDVLGVIGLVVALGAFGIAFSWNATNEQTLGQLKDAISTLDARNAELAGSVAALQASIADLDAIRHAVGRAAMTSTPESFVDLLLDDLPDGTTYGELVELGRSRLWGEPTMYGAVEWLREQGNAGYEEPLVHQSRVWRTTRRG